MALASKLKTAFRSMEVAAIDRWLNIDTTSMYETLHDRSGWLNDSNWYESCDYILLRRYLDEMELSPADTVYDIGCGMGRVLCLLARRELKKVVGIEFSPEIAETARINLRHLRGKVSPAEVITGDASKVDYADGTLFILVNPFGEETMKLVLERIRQDVEATPRPVRFAYLNPRHDDVLQASGWLTLVRKTGVPGYWTKMSYWRSRSTG